MNPTYFLRNNFDETVCEIEKIYDPLLNKLDYMIETLQIDNAERRKV